MLFHFYAEELSDSMYKLAILAVVLIIFLVWAELRSRKLKQADRPEPGVERDKVSGQKQYEAK